jgi:hypothetical protein
MPRLKPPPSEGAERDEQADANCSLDGQDDENPLEAAVSTEAEADTDDGKEAEAVDATKGKSEQGQHPEPVDDQAAAPEEGGDFAEAEFARIGAAGDLFDAEVTFADVELPNLEDQEQRGEEQDGGHAWRKSES